MKKLVFVLCLSILAVAAFARTTLEVKADLAKTKAALAQAKAANGNVTEFKLELAKLNRELSSTAGRRADRLDDGGETCDDATVVSSLPYTDGGVISEVTGDDYVNYFCGIEGAELVYTFVVGEDALPSGNYSVNTCGSDFDTVIELWRGCPGGDASEFLDCNDDLANEEECGDNNSGLSSCIPDLYLSPGTYYVTVAGYGFDVGDYVLTIGIDIDCGGQGTTCPASAPNSYCNNAEFLDMPGGYVQVLASSTLGAFPDGLESCGTTPEACGLWYEVVGTGNLMLAHTCHDQTNYDTKINVYTGTCDNLVCVGGNDDWYDNDGNYACEDWIRASGVEWCSIEGQSYFIFVNGYDGDVGRFNLTVEDLYVPCCDTYFDYYFSTTQVPFCQCLSICPGDILKIFVGPATEFQRPVASWSNDCADREVPGSCASDCYPAYPELYMDWVYLPNEQLWCMDLYSEQGGCFCFCIDRLLPVELNGFTAVAGDGEVALNWSTGSESEIDHFEIERGSVTLAQIAATNSAGGATYSWTDETAENGTTYTYNLVVVNMNGSRDVLDTQSAVPQLGSGSVTEFALAQNFPNPFNPETSISFSLPEISNVELKVFNAIGQEVAVLANGTYSSGNHVVKFSGEGLSSGVYFYTLKAGNFSAQHKMLLLK